MMRREIHKIGRAGAVLALTAALLTGSAGADEIVQSGGGTITFNKDTAEITYIFGTGPTLTLPTTVEEVPVKGLSDNASVPFYGTEIIIPDTYTKIGYAAFSDSMSLEKIRIPDSVTDLGGRVFMNCQKLEEVTLPSGLTTIPEHLFWQCYSLEQVDIPDTVTSIEEAGFGWSGITSIEIPNSVTSIGPSAFNSCAGLTELTIPASVTSIGDSAFSNCTGLTSFDWPASVPVIEDTMFRANYAMEQITIPATVTRIGDSVFQFCRSLTDIYYAGTQEQWESIDMGTNYWDGITIHYAGGETPQPTAPAEPAGDQPSAWAAEQVRAAVAAGIVPEPLQSQYAQPTTRAEFCALAVALYETATGGEIAERETFSDTSDVNVEKMAALGVTGGVGEGRFDPDAQLTREQAATMLSRLAAALGEPLAGQAPSFADSGSISSWAVEPVGQMQASGIMGGVGGNAFDPQGDYTREQSILTMLRLFELAA